MGEITIGCGSGNSSSRREKSLKVATQPEVNYLCCDRLAERTLANAKSDMLDDPERGYNPPLESWFEALLPVCADHDVTVIGSFGAANTPKAGQIVAELCEDLGLDLNVAAVLGDDVLETLLEEDLEIRHWQTNEPIDFNKQKIAHPGRDPILAHAYLGSEAIVEALKKGADVIVTGRVADLSLFLAPLIYEFDWSENDLDEMGGGGAVGHLLECGAYATGANLYQPGYINVPGMDDIGFPIARVRGSGEAVITKPDDTGGIVSEMTLRTQLCHEILDPSEYKSPDLVIDMTEIELERIGEDEVHVSGAKGKPKPEQLKMLVGYDNGYLIEVEQSWAGSDSYAKAEACIERGIKPNVERWKHYDRIFDGPRYEIVGVNSIHGPAEKEPDCDPNEVRIRIAAKIDDESIASDFKNLVNGLGSMTGGAGRGAKFSNVQKNITIFPSLISRDKVTPRMRLNSGKRG